MDVGTKFEVIKNGTAEVNGAPVRFRGGDIWDIVGSEILGPQFRKLNQSGGSKCILNGMTVARAGLREGYLREMTADEPMAVEHDALRERTGAR